MKIPRSQSGHAHVVLLLTVIVSLISVVGYTVYTRQSSVDLANASAQAAPQTCDDLENLPDDQYEAIPDDVYNRLCGSDDVAAPTAPEPTTDPGLVTDPCAELTDEQIYAMTDAQYAAQCGGGVPTDSDETTDGGQSPASANTVTVPGKNNKGSKTVSADLTTKSQCVSTIGQMASVSKAALGITKTYGADRIKSRKASLQAEYKKFNKKSSVSTNLKNRRASANVQLKAVAKKYHKKRYTKVKLAKLPSHKSQINKEVRSTKSALTKYASSLKKSKTASAVASNTCGAIFDTQVLAYTIPKMRTQKSLDNLYAQNAAYDVNYQMAASLAKMRGRKLGAGMTNPSVIKSKIDALQNNLNNVSAASVNNQLNSGGSSTNFVANKVSSGRAEVKNLIASSNKNAKKRVKALD